MKTDRAPVGWRLWLLQMANRVPVEWRFWLLQMGVTAAGEAVVVAVAVAVVGAAGGAVAVAVTAGKFWEMVGANEVVWTVGWAVVGGMLGAMLGAIVGPLQWLVLRQGVPDTRLWVVASIVGWAAPWAVGRAVLDPPPTSGAGGAVVGGAVGAIAGTLQWLVLRRGAPNAVLWMLASILGGAVPLAVLGAALGLFTALLGAGME